MDSPASSNTCLRGQIPRVFRSCRPPLPRTLPGLHPSLPWALFTVVALREIDPEISKQDAKPRRRAGEGRGWVGAVLRFLPTWLCALRAQIPRL